MPLLKKIEFNAKCKQWSMHASLIFKNHLQLHQHNTLTTPAPSPPSLVVMHSSNRLYPLSLSVCKEENGSPNLVKNNYKWKLAAAPPWGPSWVRLSPGPLSPPNSTNRSPTCPPPHMSKTDQVYREPHHMFIRTQTTHASHSRLITLLFHPSTPPRYQTQAPIMCGRGELVPCNRCCKLSREMAIDLDPLCSPFLHELTSLL
jgi:hypothetical protein